VLKCECFSYRLRKQKCPLGWFFYDETTCGALRRNLCCWRVYSI